MGFSGNGNDRDRGRPLLLGPIAPIRHYSNTPTLQRAATAILQLSGVAKT